MAITYRQGNNGRLSVAQMDNNFRYLEDQLAGLTSSNSGSGATGATGPQGATGPAGFGTTGGISFPFLPGNERTGSGDNLQFEKGSVYQKIISTQDGTESAPTVERLVISGGDSYRNGPTYSGEGGDVYLYGGKGQLGGDIKVDAGNGISSGGTVKVRGGYTNTGDGGFVEISAGYSSDGDGGDVQVTAGNGYNGGSVNISPGAGTNTGGNITLTVANGGTAAGNVIVRTETGNERMRITYDGKIGIGTSTPTVALDVVGDLNITGDFISPLNFAQGSQIESIANSSSDGLSASTITLKPDSSLNTDQYIVVEPTAGVGVPDHIHIRAGGPIDNSSVDLIIGGEETNLKISDTTKTVEIRTNATASWQFGETGITFPDNTIQTTADSRPYKVYTALLTQTGTSSVQSISTGDLTVGVTYTIGIGSFFDFTNVGAPDNNTGTIFVATATTPTSWGSVSLTYDTGAPITTVLENTLDYNPTFTREGAGIYRVYGTFTNRKTIASIPNNVVSSGIMPVLFYNGLPNYIVIGLRNVDNSFFDDEINTNSNFYIEIKVYN